MSDPATTAVCGEVGCQICPTIADRDEWLDREYLRQQQAASDYVRDLIGLPRRPVASIGSTDKGSTDNG